jgi:hypothetical protein
VMRRGTILVGCRPDAANQAKSERFQLARKMQQTQNPA